MFDVYISFLFGSLLLTHSMRFLVLCICIGFSTGATIRSPIEAEATKINERDAISLGAEPFEVISLNSHNVQSPLIIRSRIPESDRLQSSTLGAANENFFAQQTSGQIESVLQHSSYSPFSSSDSNNYEANLSSQNAGFDALSVINIASMSDFDSLLDSDSVFGVMTLLDEEYLNKENIFTQQTNNEQVEERDKLVSPYSPYLNPPSSESIINAANSSSQSSDTLSTINIGSMSDFESLLDSESTLGAGVMSFDENSAKSLENPSLETKTNNLLFVPAQLQYETVGNFNPPPKTEESKETQGINLSTASEKRGYTIEEVPVVASYSRVGPFSSADIPSITQIETIFRTHTPAHESKQNIEGRSGLVDINNEATTTEITTETVTESEPNHSNLVDLRIAPASAKQLVENNNNSISNEIDNDNGNLTVASRLPEEISAAQPLNIGAGLNVINAIEGTIKSTESLIIINEESVTTEIASDTTIIINEELATTTSDNNEDDIATESSPIETTISLESSDAGLFLSAISDDNSLASKINSEEVFTSKIPLKASDEEIIETTQNADISIETTTLEAAVVSI